MKGTLNIKIYYSGIIRKSWKWKAIAPNRKIIASGRGFNTKDNAVDSINTLIRYVLIKQYSLSYK